MRTGGATNVAAQERWKDRQFESNRVFAATLALIALGFVLSFPPVWRIFA